MWNEAGAAAAGDSEAPVIGDVVHIGRSWFRMTAMPATATKTARIGEAGSSEPQIAMARSLFERTRAREALPEEALLDDPSEEAMFEPSGRTVTLSWWWVGLAASGLLSIGALTSAVLLRRPVPASAPVAARAAVVPPAPVAAVPAPLATAAPVAPPPAVPAAIQPPAAPEVVAVPAVVPPASVQASVAVTEPAAPVHRTQRRAPALAVRTAPVARSMSAARAVPAGTRRASRPTASSPSRAKASAPDSEKPWVDPFSL